MFSSLVVVIRRVHFLCGWIGDTIAALIRLRLGGRPADVPQRLWLCFLGLERHYLHVVSER